MAAENIHTPTGFIRARQYCGAIYKTGYAQTWDHAWIIASNPSSSNVPGVINFVR